MQRSCRLRGETAGMRIVHLRLIFKARNLDLCYLVFPFSPPSLLGVYTVANEQGGVEGESIGGTDITSDGMGQQRAVRHRRLMCWEKESCRMDWHRPCLFWGHCRQSEHPEERVSRHTVRPGT